MDVCKVSILNNIKHRETFALSKSVPVLKDISKMDDGSYSRSLYPDGKTMLYVSNIQVVRCADTNCDILVGEMAGRNPRSPLDTSGHYKVLPSGGIRDGKLTELDYFTVSDDYSDNYSPLRVSKVTPIKEWCRVNK